MHQYQVREDVRGNGDWAEQLGWRLVAAIEDIACSLRQIKEAHAPAQHATVGTRYVANHLGKTPTWIAQMAREEKIPKNCIVPGTGSETGTRWVFYREHIDRWLQAMC